MFPLVKAGHAEIALSDDEAELEASSPSSMLQLSIEQSMMRGALCTASTSSAALDSAAPVTQGQTRKRDIHEETKASEEPYGYELDLGQGPRTSEIHHFSHEPIHRGRVSEH